MADGTAQLECLQEMVAILTDIRDDIHYLKAREEAKARAIEKIGPAFRDSIGKKD